MPILKLPFRTLEKYARVVCVDCIKAARMSGNQTYDGSKFLSVESYDAQLRKPGKGWKCPDCKQDSCIWDDAYFDLPLQKGNSS